MVQYIKKTKKQISEMIKYYHLQHKYNNQDDFLKTLQKNRSHTDIRMNIYNLDQNKVKKDSVFKLICILLEHY